MDYIEEYIKTKSELTNCTNKIYEKYLLKKIYHLRSLINLEYGI